MLFSLHFQSQLRRIRPGLVASLEGAITRAAEISGAKVRAEHRCITASFEEQTIGFALDILLVVNAVRGAVRKVLPDLYGHTCVFGRDIAEDGLALLSCLYLKYNGGDSFPLIEQFITGEQFDGLVCVTSTLCYELIEVFDALDESWRKNIKIISFDDNRWFDYIKYPISVISQPVAEIGNAALENVLQLIEPTGAVCEVKRKLLFEISIIER
jgi:hypothetical protein